MHKASHFFWRASWVALLTVSLAGFGAPAAAQAVPAASGGQVALVIGNSRYKSAPLLNPVNDSRAVAAKLRNIGFTVIERENLETRQIPSTIREFRSSLKPGGVALIFYAGHGVQIKGVNYLPAVDAEITSEEDVPLQSIDLNRVLEMLGDSKTRLNLLFLDACRNNPYARSMRSAGNGLAKVEAPSGTLISFATRPGSTASDGGGTHGVYTEHLLRAMDNQDQPIELALKQVVSGVKRATRGAQEPWMEGSIEGDFFFRGGEGTLVASAPAPVPQLAAPVPQLAAPVPQLAGSAPAPAVGRDASAPAPVVASAVPTASRASARKLVAIIGFENKSTYGADKLWDTSGQFLTTGLLEMGVFRLVEWERMKQLFDWHALSTNALVKSPEKRAEARKILLTEYFISGAITQFDVSQSGEVSALSKRKVYTTNIRVDLQMQDSATGEYISGATGQTTARQEFSGDFTGGQTGGWDPKKADDALNEAIQKALGKLVDSYRRNVETQ